VDGVAFKKTFSYAGFEQQPKSFTSEWPCTAATHTWRHRSWRPAVLDTCGRSLCMTGLTVPCLLQLVPSLIYVAVIIAHQGPFKLPCTLLQLSTNDFMLRRLPPCRPQDPAAQH
jgi:hypothetical protein